MWSMTGSEWASATFDLEAEAVHQAEDGDDRVFILSEVPADYWFC
jgi:hypothetical protein